MSFRLWYGVVATALCVPALTACSSGGSAATRGSASPPDPTAAAAQAAAACRAVDSIVPIRSSQQAAQVRYTREVAAGFAHAKALATQASQEDPRWTRLATTASQEAAAFATLLSASTVGTTSEGPVSAASRVTHVDRPIFIHECNEAVAAAKK